MKKLILIAAVAVAGLTSCKKDYECTYELTILGTTTTSTATCAKCSKSDVQELEDAGWECE